MKALILAAGFGTRLRPFTNHTPKTLVPVHNIPLILYILAFLKHNGIKDVVINLHHLGHKIKKFLGNGSKIGMKIRYSFEPKILGTGGGIKKALRFTDDPTLIINGDVIADFDLKEFIRQHKKNNPYATLALHKAKNAHRYGLLYYKGSNLTSILNHPKANKNTKSAMFGSFHLLSKKQTLTDLKKFKPNKQFCIMRDIYIPQILKGKSFGAYPIQGFWTVCDSMADIKKTEKKLSQKGFKLSYQQVLQQLAKKLQSV